jgi:hypothetical protein
MIKLSYMFYQRIYLIKNKWYSSTNFLKAWIKQVIYFYTNKNISLRDKKIWWLIYSVINTDAKEIQADFNKHEQDFFNSCFIAAPDKVYEDVSYEKIIIDENLLMGLLYLPYQKTTSLNKEKYIEKIIKFIELKKNDNWLFGFTSKKQILINKCFIVALLFHTARQHKDYRALNAALKLFDSIYLNILFKACMSLIILLELEKSLTLQEMLSC